MPGTQIPDIPRCMWSDWLGFLILESHPGYIKKVGYLKNNKPLANINSTFDAEKMLFKTRNNVTNIPPLPGTIFGGTKKDTEVRITNPTHGR